MKKILAIWIVIAMLLVGGLTFIGFNLDLRNQAYHDLEDKLLNSAKDYYSQYPDLLPSNQLVITASELINSNFLTELVYNNEPCSGYVIVKKTYLVHDYISYIKCGDYNTKDYNEGDAL